MVLSCPDGAGHKRNPNIVTSSLAPKEAELPASQIQCSGISTGSSLYIPPHSSRPDDCSCGRERPGPGPRPSSSSAEIASDKEKFYDILHSISKNVTELNWHLAYLTGLVHRLPGNSSSSALGSSPLPFLSPLACHLTADPCGPRYPLSGLRSEENSPGQTGARGRARISASSIPGPHAPRPTSSHRPGAASAARQLLIFGRPPILPVPGPEKVLCHFAKLCLKCNRTNP